MSSSNTSPAPWFADTGRNAVYDKRVGFDESGARFGDTPNLVVRIEGGRPADVHLIAAAPARPGYPAGSRRQITRRAPVLRPPTTNPEKP